MSSQIQQFIDQPAYQPEHPISFRISGSGLRRARSADAKSGGQAILCVSYTMPQTCFPIADDAAIKLWHKADQDVYEDGGTDLAETGDGVARWANFAQGGSDAVQAIAGKRPIYSEAIPAGVFNGSGGLSFGSNRSLSLPDDWQENGFYAFIVQRSGNSASPQAILASTEAPDRPVLQVFKDEDEYFARLGTASQNAQVRIGTDATAGSEYHILEVGHFNDVLTVSFDGKANFNESFVPAGASTGLIQQILLGEDPNDDLADFQGEIAEIILLDRPPNGVEKGQILTYLSIRHGIRIGFNRHNYYSYGSHDDRLFGIGQNLDQRCLFKDNSRSVMPGNRVRFSEPSDLDEGEFLVSGDDDGSEVQPSFNVPPGFSLRLARSWRVQEFGEAGTITLEFDLSGLSANLDQAGRYFLLRDDDGDFADASILNNTIPSLQDSVLRFTDIDLNDGDYYTLAYREGVQVRPKVILSGAYNA
ncbi:MAG: hypothetical protein AAGM67_09955, partial [Bacteroidota bacterium]